MPAPHWSVVTLAAAAAAGLFRRRAVAADGGDAAPVVARPTTEEMLAARPTPAAVQSYAYNGCTDREIADRFGLAEADVRATFGAVLAMARSVRAYALRKAQTDLATGKGNAAMLTWLGRNELGQALHPAGGGEPEPDVE